MALRTEAFLILFLAVTVPGINVAIDREPGSWLRREYPRPDPIQAVQRLVVDSRGDFSDSFEAEAQLNENDSQLPASFKEEVENSEALGFDPSQVLVPALQQNSDGSVSTVGEDEFNRRFQMSKYFIIHRLCRDCDDQHRHIFYRRWTNTSAFKPYKYMACSWNKVSNVLGQDFTLYSSLNDAMADQKPWKFCDYNTGLLTDLAVGFPKGCGLNSSATGIQWSAMAVSGCAVVLPGMPSAFYIMEDRKVVGLRPDAVPCLEQDIQYTPMDMIGQLSSIENNIFECQQRCRSVIGCVHFGFWPGNVCHLQDIMAVPSAAKNVSSGPPTCAFFAKAGSTSVQDCMLQNTQWTPLDMAGQVVSSEANASTCRDRCRKVSGCQHFSFWPAANSNSTGFCHLEDRDAEASLAQGVISGPPDCQQAPRKHKPDDDDEDDDDATNLTCQDSVQPFNVSNTTQVLCANVTMLLCANGTIGPKVRELCPLTCGDCIASFTRVRDCADQPANSTPLFLMDGLAANCSQLVSTCSQNPHVALKCPLSCGTCKQWLSPAEQVLRQLLNKTQLMNKSYVADLMNDTLDINVSQVTGCSRRRSLGFCSTRRRSA